MKIIMAILQSLPAEIAHRIGITGLLILRYAGGLLGRRPIVAPTIHVPSTRWMLRSRVGLAAGFDKDARIFSTLSCLGFGFVEVGTVTPLAQPGNPRPRLWRVGPNTLINSFGFNSKGIDAFHKSILSQQYARRAGLIVLANIGKNRMTPNEAAIEDYRLCVERLSDSVDGFVFNLSSPNTPGLTSLQSVSFLESLARLVPSGKTAFVKLSPDLPNAALASLCTAIGEEHRFTGAVVGNTSSLLAKQLYNRTSGGLSGAPLYTRALECVAIARENLGVRKCLIGCGGISSPEDARKMLAAGADLIELYTAFVCGGPKLIREIVSAVG